MLTSSCGDSWRITDKHWFDFSFSPIRLSTLFVSISWGKGPHLAMKPLTQICWNPWTPCTLIKRVEVLNVKFCISGRGLETENIKSTEHVQTFQRVWIGKELAHGFYSRLKVHSGRNSNLMFCSTVRSMSSAYISYILNHSQDSIFISTMNLSTYER